MSAFLHQAIRLLSRLGSLCMRSSPRRYGFTPIVRLVVIAIIAILIGLLLPAVQSVREATVGGMSEAQAKLLGKIYRGLKPASAPTPMSFSLTSPMTAVPSGKFTCKGTVIGAGRVVMVDFFGDNTNLSQVWTLSGVGGAWSVTLDSGSKRYAGYSIAFYDMTDDGAPGDMQYWQVDFGTNK